MDMLKQVKSDVTANSVKDQLELLKSRNGNIMSQEDIKEARRTLNDLKQVARLSVEGKKLLMIENVVDGIIKNIELANTADIEVKTAMDVKFLAEANEKNYKLLENLYRIDSADEKGTAAMTQIMIKTVDSHGNETSAFVGVK